MSNTPITRLDVVIFVIVSALAPPAVAMLLLVVQVYTLALMRGLSMPEGTVSMWGDRPFRVIMGTALVLHIAFQGPIGVMTAVICAIAWAYALDDAGRRRA